MCIILTFVSLGFLNFNISNQLFHQFWIVIRKSSFLVCCSSFTRLFFPFKSNRYPINYKCTKLFLCYPFYYWGHTILLGNCRNKLLCEISIKITICFLLIIIIFGLNDLWKQNLNVRVHELVNTRSNREVQCRPQHTCTLGWP